MTPEPDENRLDQSLRSKFDDFDLVPGAPVWVGIAARLGPPPRLRPRRRPWLVPLLFVLTAFVAGLGGWLLPHRPAVLAGASRTRIVTSNNRQPELRSSGTLAYEPGSPLRSSGVTNSGPRSPLRSSGMANSARRLLFRSSATTNSVRRSMLRSSGVAESTPVTQAAKSPADNTATIASAAAVAIQVVPGTAPNEPAALAPTGTLPATLRPLAALERQTLVQLPSVGTLAPGTLPADGRAALLATLRAERAELFRLQRRTDSLLLALGDLPGAGPVRVELLDLLGRSLRQQTIGAPPGPSAKRWTCAAWPPGCTCCASRRPPARP